MRARNLFWLAAVSLSLIAVSLQQASADPVTDVTFGASETNNGTIGLGFYFLNSNGANPLTSSSSWSSLSRLNLAFSATTGSDTFSNLGFAATSVSSFGAPDTTTYGEVFQLPSEDALESWTFLIKNNPGPGTQATFGLA